MHGPRKGQRRSKCGEMGLPQTICGLGEAGSQEDMGWGRSHQANAASELSVQQGGFNTGKMAPICRLPSREAQLKSNGSCPSSHYLGVTQLSLSLYVSSTSQAADPPPVLRVSVCERVSLCVSPLRVMSGFSGSFCLTWMTRISTDFYSQILWGFLFLGVELWAREPLCGARTPLSFGEGYLGEGGWGSAATLSFTVINCHNGCRISLFHVSPLVLVAVAFSLYSQMYVL